MGIVMEIVNAPLRVLFDLLLLPFRSFHPLVGLTVISALCAVLMLLGYRATSNQEGIESTKRQIAAGLFEIRLFNDDLTAILRSQGRILRHNLEYMRLNLVPMFWMLVPFVLIVAQLQFHYGYRGLEVDRPATLTVELSDGDPRGLELEVPDGVRIDAPRVAVAAAGEASWRIVPEREGVFDLTFRLDGQSYQKRLVVSDDVLRRAPERFAPDFVDQLIYPAEAPLPADAPLRTIRVTYPDREVGIAGWDSHWLVAFLILTIGLAFALKGRFGVTI